MPVIGGDHPYCDTSGGPTPDATYPASKERSQRQYAQLISLRCTIAPKQVLLGERAADDLDCRLQRRAPLGLDGQTAKTNTSHPQVLGERFKRFVRFAEIS